MTLVSLVHSRLRVRGVLAQDSTIVRSWLYNLVFYLQTIVLDVPLPVSPSLTQPRAGAARAAAARVGESEELAG
jgi:hypothetical protein